MGVRGLTTYIAENSNKYLKPYELCDSYLVIDGSSIASNLYQWQAKSDSAFGGDYDEYYKVVYDFFSMLIKCKVTPIVLFDGGYERRKLETLFSRLTARIQILKKFAKGYSDAKFFPLFLKQTFFDVMTDLNICCIQCDLEADFEIATVARVLNCPVLSYDSDFYIFDVLYIPFSTVHVKPVQFPNSNKYFVRCSLYDVEHFLKQFSGLDKTHLPVIATLLGNDYIQSSLFGKFFGHISMSKKKNVSFNQRKIHGVLHWLENKNIKTATDMILNHVENKNAGKVLNAIKTSTKDYTSNFVSKAVLKKLKTILNDVQLKNNTHFNINIPDEVLELFSECKIHKLIIDIATMSIYFPYLQIENVPHESSHFASLGLISNIYTLLVPYINTQYPLKIYVSYKNHFTGLKIRNDKSSFLNNVLLGDILKEPKEERLKWLCSIVGIDDDDLNIVSVNNWSIFLMSFIYWIKNLKSSIKTSHVHALVLMAIANEIVQKCVGYFRNMSKFMKSKGSLISSLKKEKIEAKESNTFDKMLDDVTLYEKLYMQSVLLPYRLTMDKSCSKAYDISIIHLFACFQSCLFHIMQLNAMLNFPLPHLKISDFYSGTLLFNFYLIIKTKPNFGSNLFKQTPNLAKIYNYLFESFWKFSNEAAPEVRKPRKKRNKKKKVQESIKEEVYFCDDHDDDDNDLDYVDENNPFAALRGGVM